MRKIEFNPSTGTFIKNEEIRVGNAIEAGEIRQALKIELAGIVRQVKGLKARAEEIKTMLAALDSEKPIILDSAPVESQLSPVE